MKRPLSIALACSAIVVALWFACQPFSKPGSETVAARSSGSETGVRHMDDDEAERAFLLSEFRKRGGQIREEFIDAAVDSYIEERFDGDRAKFLTELREADMTIARFRETQRDQIVIEAYSQRSSEKSAIPRAAHE